MIRYEVNFLLILIQKILSIVRQSIQASCSVNNNGTLCYNVFASSFGANSQVRGTHIVVLLP